MNWLNLKGLPEPDKQHAVMEIEIVGIECQDAINMIEKFIKEEIHNAQAFQYCHVEIITKGVH